MPTIEAVQADRAHVKLVTARNDFVLEVLCEITRERYAIGQTVTTVDVARELGLLVELYPAGGTPDQVGVVMNGKHKGLMIHLDIV